MHEDSRVKPSDSDFIARIKLGIMFMLLFTMIGGAVLDWSQFIDIERGYRLLGMIGFAVGTCVDRYRWTGHKQQEE